MYIRSQAIHKRFGLDLTGLQVDDFTGNTSRDPDQNNNKINFMIYAPNVPTKTTRLNK